MIGRKQRRILIIRTDRLGDVVLATPLIRALRQAFPQAHLAALVRPYARDVLLHNPNLDEILVDDRDGEHRGKRGFWKQVAVLRARRFDTALLLLPTSRAAWMLFWAGIRRRIGVGRKLFEVLTFMESVSRNKYIPLRHEADYCLDLGRRLGVRSDDLSTEVFLTPDERAAAQVRFERAGVFDGDRLVGIHPGSGGSSPNWRPERYAQLAAKLLAETLENVRIVVTGEESVPRFPISPRLVDWRGRRPLRELIADLAQLDCFVSSSTGPMHLAGALRVPTVSLFCPLPACSPQLWGTQGNRSRAVLPPDGFCQGRCVGDPKLCGLEEIAVEDVTAAILVALRDDGGGGARQLPGREAHSCGERVSDSGTHGRRTARE